MQGYDAIILAGGTGQRLGGTDKAALVVGGRTLLDRAIAAVPAAGQIVVVGPPRPTPRPVTWTSEDPPLGGPAAAVAAGLAHISAPGVVVLAVDMPFAAQAVPRLLAAHLPDGVLLTDDTGHHQPLLAVYRTAALQQAVMAQPTTAGLSMRQLIATLDLDTIDAAGVEALDCDTRQQLSDAEAEAQRGAGRLGTSPG